jgi:hypothetical protein
VILVDLEFLRGREANLSHQFVQEVREGTDLEWRGVGRGSLDLWKELDSFDDDSGALVGVVCMMIGVGFDSYSYVGGHCHHGWDNNQMINPRSANKGSIWCGGDQHGPLMGIILKGPNPMVPKDVTEPSLAKTP